MLSREFWLFVAALVLLFSAGLIGFTTSIPVYNKIVNQLSTVLDFNAMKYLKTAPLTLSITTIDFPVMDSSLHLPDFKPRITNTLIYFPDYRADQNNL
ncbi:MAG: hypothetical protein IPM86_02300 [Saprospiraceae bacterium]|nr:hypothetical protein [Saprospiraceae bacterium]